MKEFWSLIQLIFAAVRGWIDLFLGGYDGLLCALITFVVIDYITGMFCAGVDHKLSSEVGFKSICQKLLIFILVGVGNIIDVQILGNSNVLRTAVIFFYLSNEGLSLLNNSANLGLPIPHKLKDILEQLHDRAKKEDKDD